ncbi:MAG: hypothetical protein AVDCRST_MAG93-5160, partial [uncultured Chloroflexia bacterium]
MGDEKHRRLEAGMVWASWIRTVVSQDTPQGALANLEELRLRLASRVAFLTAVTTGLAMW